MPRIPRVQEADREQSTVDDGSTSFDANGLSTSRGTVDAALEDAQYQVENLGRDIKHFSEQRDAAIAVGLFTENAAALRDYLNYPQSGILNRRGASAVGAAHAVRTHLDETRAEARRQLSKPQQALFAKLFDAHAAVVLERATEHERREHAAHVRVTLDAAVENAIEDAIDNFERPDIARRAGISIRGFLDAFAEPAGLNPDDVAHLLERSLTSIHVGIANNLARTDTETALAHLDRFRNEIDASERVALEAALGRIAEDRAIADAVRRSPASEESPNGAGRTFDAPELNARFKQGVALKRAREERQQRARHAELYTHARRIVVGGGGLERIAPLDRLALEAAGLWPSLGSLSKRMTAGVSVADNPGLRFELTKATLAGSEAPDPLRLASMHDLGLLSADDVKKIASLGDGSDRKSKIARAARRIELSQIEAGLARAGILRGNEDFESRRDAFLNEWDAYALQVETRERRPATFRELAEISEAVVRAGRDLSRESAVEEWPSKRKASRRNRPADAVK